MDRGVRLRQRQRLPTFGRGPGFDGRPWQRACADRRTDLQAALNCLRARQCALRCARRAAPRSAAGRARGLALFRQSAIASAQPAHQMREVAMDRQLSEMKLEWDKRAQTAAKWYINTLSRQQTDEEFDASGLVEVQRL